MPHLHLLPNVSSILRPLCPRPCTPAALSESNRSSAAAAAAAPRCRTIPNSAAVYHLGAMLHQAGHCEWFENWIVCGLCEERAHLNQSGEQQSSGSCREGGAYCPLRCPTPVSRPDGESSLQGFIQGSQHQIPNTHNYSTQQASNSCCKITELRAAAQTKKPPAQHNTRTHKQRPQKAQNAKMS